MKSSGTSGADYCNSVYLKDHFLVEMLTETVDWLGYSD